MHTDTKTTIFGTAAGLFQAVTPTLTGIPQIACQALAGLFTFLFAKQTKGV